MSANFNSTTDRIFPLIGGTFPTTGSLHMWLRPDWAVNDGVPHTFFDVFSNSTNFFRLEKFSDDDFYCGWLVGGTDYRANAVAAGLSSGTWSSIICTWDDSANDTIFYIDGTIRASNTATLVTTSISANFSTLGNSSPSAADRDLDGQIAEVAVWDRVLTSSERASLDAGNSADAAADDYLWYQSLTADSVYNADNILSSSAHPTITGPSSGGAPLINGGLVI